MADIVPGGIPSAEAHGSSKSKGVIRSWKPTNWRLEEQGAPRPIIAPVSILSGEQFGSLEFAYKIKNAGAMASAEAFGSTIVHLSTTIYAASLSRADVQTAIDSASDGDTVIMPAGSMTWPAKGGSGGGSTNGIYINNKSIWLKGAGKNLTLITDGTSGSSWPGGLVYVSGASKVRFSDFSILDIKQHGFNMYCSARDWMIHDMDIKHAAGIGSGVYVEATGGRPYGLIYNVYFENTNVDYEGLNDDDWSNDSTYGTADAVYVEDCVFTRTTADLALTTDINSGGRMVVRYNTITNGHHYSHVVGTMRRGPRHVEYYNNTHLNPQSLWVWIMIEGGSGVVWGNRIKGSLSEYSVMLQTQRGIPTGESSARNYPSGGGQGHDWADWWNAYHPGANYTYLGRDVDGAPDGYPSRDQVGMGKDGAGAYPQPQASEPVYMWDNLYTTDIDGTPTIPCLGKVNGGGNSSVFIQKDREWVESEKPGYAPYTYPHPLRG